MAIQIACSGCGSTHVTRDAWAEWDEQKQAWCLGAVFDDGFCHAWEAPMTLVERTMLTLVRNDA